MADKTTDDGVCERCGGKIGKARLKALPDTTLCVKCAQRIEDHHGVQYRTVDDCYDPGELFDTIRPDD